jgi:hypothetical protein
VLGGSHENVAAADVGGMAAWESGTDWMSFLTCSASPEDGVSFLTCSFGAEESDRPGEFDSTVLDEDFDDEYGGRGSVPIERVSEGQRRSGSPAEGVYSIRYDDRDPDVAGDALSDDEEAHRGRRSRPASPRPAPLPLDFARALPPSAAECKECARAFRKDRVMGRIAALIPVASKMDVDMLLSRVTCGLREHGRACLCDRADAKKRTILWHAVNCNDVIAVRVFLTAGAGASLSRRREDPKVDPISLALERGQEDIAESLLANLHPAPAAAHRTGPRRDDVTVLDARDDNFADMFWCCATNGLAGSGSSALRARHRDIAPYDFSPPPTSPPATPAKKKATSGFPFSPLGKRTPSSK